MRSLFKLFIIGAAIPTAAYSLTLKVSCKEASMYNGSLYNKNDYVISDNHLYQAKVPTSKLPSASDIAWHHLGICDGTPAELHTNKSLCNGVSHFDGNAFNKNDETLFNNHLWRAKGPTSSVPSKMNILWEDLGECAASRVTSSPDSPAKVSCLDISPYDGGVLNTDDLVLYDGHLWRANWYTTVPPMSSNLAWTDLGECEVKPITSRCVHEVWVRNKAYEIPTDVTHASAHYRNQWYANPNELPGSDNNWIRISNCVDSEQPNPTIKPTHPPTTTVRPTRSTTTSTPFETDDTEECDSTPPDVVSTTTKRHTTTSTKTQPTSTSKKPSKTTSSTTTAESTTSTETTTTAETTTTQSAETPTFTTPSNDEQERPTGPVGKNNECVWPYLAGVDYPGGSYVGIGDKVYQNKWYAGASDIPGSSEVWTLVASCVGTAPKAYYTDAEMLSMLDPSIKGVQVINDPWTPRLPTNAEMKASEDAAVAADPKIALLKQAARTLSLSEIESITPLRSENPENVKRVENIISESEFERLLPVRHTSYSYANFLRGIGAFPDYCKTYDDGRDSEAICRKFLAVSFAHNVQETGGNTPTLYYGTVDAEHHNVGADAHYKSGDLIPIWQQALWFLREVGHTESESSSAYEKCGYDSAEDRLWALNYPCSDTKTYYGRGSKQLSWNYNYGMCSSQLFNDPNYLLENPELVADTWLNFGTAIWFAVTPQSPKPPMTWVIDGTWVPNAADTAAGLSPGFGATIMVINGGIECGGKAPTSVSNRVNAYKNWAAELGVSIDADEDLDCSKATAFPAASTAATQTYWNRSWTKTECALVTYQGPWQVQREGDYARCVDYFFRSHFFVDGKKVSDYGDAPKPMV